MIQHKTYGNGGYVLHSVIVENRKFSAYFDANGLMVDCEEIKDHTSKTVRKQSILAELQKIGLRYTPEGMLRGFRRFSV